MLRSNSKRSSHPAWLLLWAVLIWSVGVWADERAFDLAPPPNESRRMALGLDGPRADATDASIGVIALESTGLDRPMVDTFHAQLRSTIRSIEGLVAVPMRLPEGASSTDVVALRIAARGAMIDGVLGGRLVFSGDQGLLTLIRVDASNAPPRSIDVPIPDRSLEEVLSAAEWGVCRLATAAGDRCRGRLRVDGLAGAEVWVDDKPMGVLPLAEELTLPIGTHTVQVRMGESRSQVRRLFVHHRAEVRLAAEVRPGCESVFLYQPRAEDPTCQTALPEVVVVSIPAPETRIRWVPIATAAAGVVLGVASAVAGWVAESQARQFNQRYVTTGLTEADRGTPEEIRRTAAVANGLAAVAVPVGLLGVALFWVDF